MNNLKNDDKKASKVSERSEYTWILHNYSEICNKYVHGNKIESRVFPQTGGKHKWMLSYYPNGEAYKNNVAIFLKLVSELSSDVYAKLSFSVRNSNDELIVEKQTENVYEKADSNWGYKSLVSCEHLTSLIAGDDILKIKVVILEEVFTLCSHHILSTQEGNNRESTMFREFGTQLESSEFSDFTLKLPESVEIPVHRNILAASSPVFKAMFIHKVAENDLGCAEINDISKDSMMRFLKFIYTNHIDDLSVDEAIKLIQVADKYQTLDLKERCSKVLMESLTVSNVLDVLITAHLHNAIELKRAASEYVLENPWKFTDQKKLEKLENYPSLLSELLANFFTLSIRSEIKEE